MSGPNPENDLEIMTKHGILPENVWAFESSNIEYDEAFKSALDSKFPYIKLFNIDILTFFKNSPIKFDIIYLDFCGPLPSKEQKTLSVLTQLLKNHVLNSPGVLLTNFSLLGNNNEKDNKKFAKIIAAHLYPKDYLESKNKPDDNFTEGALNDGYTPKTFLEEVENNYVFYYSQFITSLIMEFSTNIVPLTNFANSDYMKIFFPEHNKINEKDINSLYHFNDDFGDGEIIVNPNENPYLWTLATLKKRRNKKDINYPDWIYNNDELERFINTIFDQVCNVLTDKNFNKYEKLCFLKTVKPKDKLSQTLNHLYKKQWTKEYEIFTDVFNFDLLIDLLLGQLSVPYLINISRTKRWSYKAKDTRMFMDMFVLDECRYVYDWMPTVDMIDHSLKNLDRELTFRFSLDAISKNRRWYHNNLFYGAAVVDQYEEGFEAKTLEPREYIN